MLGGENMKHQINIKDFTNYKNEIILASSSNEHKKLIARINIHSSIIRIIVSKNDTIFQCDTLEEGIETYNNL